MSEEGEVTLSDVVQDITPSEVTLRMGKGALGYWLFYLYRTWRAGNLYRTDSDGKPKWRGADAGRRLSFLQFGKAAEE